MSFKISKLVRPKKIVGKSIYRKANTISDVISHARIEDLEELVIRNFDAILNASNYSEYHYFTMYKSWKNLFIKHSSELFTKLKHHCYFEAIIENFPELEADVYRFLLNGYLNDSLNEDLRKQLSIPYDILFPMIYMERYSVVVFPELREKFKEIIATAISYSEFFAIISFFENEVEIPEKLLKPIVTEFLNSDMSVWLDEQLDDFCSINELFYSAEAYDIFMSNLCELLSIYGMDLYTYVIQTFGPIPEVVAREHCCHEFCNI